MLEMVAESVLEVLMFLLFAMNLRYDFFLPLIVVYNKNCDPVELLAI